MEASKETIIDLIHQIENATEPRSVTHKMVATVLSYVLGNVIDSEAKAEIVRTLDSLKERMTNVEAEGSVTNSKIANDAVTLQKLSEGVRSLLNGMEADNVALRQDTLTELKHVFPSTMVDTGSSYSAGRYGYVGSGGDILAEGWYDNVIVEAPDTYSNPARYFIAYEKKLLHKGSIVHYSRALKNLSSTIRLCYGFTTTDPAAYFEEHGSFEGMMIERVCVAVSSSFDDDLVMPFDGYFLYCSYSYNSNWASSSVIELYLSDGLWGKIGEMEGKIRELLSLEEFNAVQHEPATAGKVIALSTRGDGDYDAYVIADGKTGVGKRPFYFINGGAKITTVADYSFGAVGTKGKGNIVNITNGTVYQGTTSGTDMRLRIYDIREYVGQLVLLEFNRSGLSSTGNNGGWSLFKKCYVKDETTGEDTAELVEYADYDFAEVDNVLLFGSTKTPRGIQHAYVRIPDDAYFLALAYYNNTTAASGQKCSYSIVEAKDASNKLDVFLNGKNYLENNLIDIGRVAGKFIGASTGNTNADYYGGTNRFFVSDFIDVENIHSLQYLIKVYCKTNVAVIAAYDENKNYLLENSVTLELKSSAKTASGIWVKGEFTRFIRIAIDMDYPNHYVNILETLPSLMSRVSAIEAIVEGVPAVVDLNKEVEYILPQMRYRGDPAKGQNTTQTTVLLHFSDIHGSVGNMRNIVNFRDYYDKFIDDVLNTGDSVANSYPNDNPQVVDGAESILTAIGNHDTATYSGGSYSWYAHSGVDAYNKFLKPYMFENVIDEDTEEITVINRWGVVQPADAEANGYCWYYKDYPSGVRLIVLDYMNAMEAQTLWLRGILADALDNNKSVIIASHIVPGAWNALPCGMTQSQTTSTSSTYGGSAQFADNLAEVQSFIDAGGDFVCWLAGHAHNDFVGTHQTYTKQILVRVATASYEGTETSITRLSSGISFDDFNIICVDPSSKLLQLVKVGSPYNRALMKRSLVCIKYDEQRIVWGEY